MIKTLFPFAIFLFVLQLACVTGKHAKTLNQEKVFRDYEHASLRVQEFYRLQHENQTLAFVKRQLSEINQRFDAVGHASEKTLDELEKAGKIKRLSIWDAILELDKLTDESDPDFTLPNSMHLLQVAEGIRHDLPAIAQRFNRSEEELDWFILIGLLHDIGKVDALLRKLPQWAAVGDTFPMGCKFSHKIIFADFFKKNPDINNEDYQSEFGIYNKNTGLNNLIMSYGHDEYAYQVLSRQGKLPKEALSMLRFHSFYPLHKEGAYYDLLAKEDHEQIAWIKEFSRFDLYTKAETRPDKEALKPFYKKLIAKYFPTNEKLIWPVLSAVE